MSVCQSPCVCLSVCLLGMFVHPAQTAELIGQVKPTGRPVH